AFLTVQKSLFEGNTGVNGAAIYSEKVKITDSAFINNTASDNGGAIYLSFARGSYIANSTFYGNSANRGGAIYVTGSSNTGAAPMVGSLTIAGNYAKTAGGGIFVQNSAGTLGIANSIILGNTSGGTADADGVITGAVADDIAVYQEAADSTSLLYAAGRSVIGAVTHLGMPKGEMVDPDTGETVEAPLDGMTVRNPMVDLEGNVIAEVRNVEYTESGSNAKSAIYKTDNVIKHPTYTVDALVSKVFGDSIELNDDDKTVKTVKTYYAEGLTTDGVIVTVNSGPGNTDSNSLCVTYQMENGKWVYIRHKPSTSVTATSNGGTGANSYTATKDQNGLSREFEYDGATHLVRRASADLIVSQTLQERQTITVEDFAGTNVYGDALVLTETKKEITIQVNGADVTLYLDLYWKVADGAEIATDGTQNAGTYADVLTLDAASTVYTKGDDGTFTDVSDQYTFDWDVLSDLTIGKRTLTVTADAQTKLVYEADPELTYTVDGLVNKDTLTGGLVRNAGDTAGTYAITQGNLAATDNYIINYTGAELTILPPPTVTVESYDAIFTYGEKVVLTETKRAVTVDVKGEEVTLYLDIVWKANGVAVDGTQDAGTYDDVLTVD
ncbi:MAG: hypothetical protein J6Q65_04005, partial [Lentisphaeria bacterium]|nr:hypothetical protein [Lentisphaeria bacterium]